MPLTKKGAKRNGPEIDDGHADIWFEFWNERNPCEGEKATNTKERRLNIFEYSSRRVGFI